jgi:endonuclease YncB( thermonuclease family)
MSTTRGEKIRLACIDAPEMRASTRLRPTSMQAETYDNTNAVESRDYLRQLVVGKKVSIRRIKNDRYGRTVAELFDLGSNRSTRACCRGGRIS